MKIAIKFQDKDKLDSILLSKLEIAMLKGRDLAVETLPARGETKYSTGRLRESIRVQRTGELEYTIYCPMSHGKYIEFGTGPLGKLTGTVAQFPSNPTVSYHSGQVQVTRAGGKVLDKPRIRYTQGQVAQPFIRPALLKAVEVFKELMK